MLSGRRISTTRKTAGAIVESISTLLIISISFWRPTQLIFLNLGLFIHTHFFKIKKWSYFSILIFQCNTLLTPHTWLTEQPRVDRWRPEESHETFEWRGIPGKFPLYMDGWPWQSICGDTCYTSGYLVIFLWLLFSFSSWTNSGPNRRTSSPDGPGNGAQTQRRTSIQSPIWQQICLDHPFWHSCHAEFNFAKLAHWSRSFWKLFNSLNIYKKIIAGRESQPKWHQL